MPKFILLSIVLVMAFVPVLLSSARFPRKALRSAQLTFLAFVFVWAYTSLTWYPQLVPLDGKIGTWK